MGAGMFIGAGALIGEAQSKGGAGAFVGDNASLRVTFCIGTTLQSIWAGPYEGNEDIATTTVSF